MESGTNHVHSNQLKKTAYWFDNADKVLIIYSGDITLAKKRPHGNSKCKRPFVRTTKSAINNLKTFPLKSMQKQQLLETKKFYPLMCHLTLTLPRKGYLLNTIQLKMIDN